MIIDPFTPPISIVAMTPPSSAYLLVIRESSPESYETMMPEQRRQSMREWNEWVDGLVARGRVQLGHPLAPEGRIVSGARGQRIVDGPFAEAKEVIGGFFLLSAESIDDATALVQQCPSLQHGMTIEIRPIADACHLARSLGWQTMEEPVNA